jgi:hypothetical protein
MKTYVLTISKTFPSYHSRAGEPTNFIQKIKDKEKLHTLRANYPLWEKRFKEIEAGRAVLSVRQWSGKPYEKGTKQEEIFRFYRTSGIGIEKYCSLQSSIYPPVLANNDGLSLEDFDEWFKIYDMEPKAIIHFTDFFRYNVGKVGKGNDFKKIF